MSDKEKVDGQGGFGRDPAIDGESTDLGCPDCRGVLRVTAENRAGLRRFRCLIGHAFSSESLLFAKEEQLEDSLWTALETFQEIRLLHLSLAVDARARDDHALAGQYEERAARAEAHAEAIRQIISSDGPAVLEEVAE